MFFISSVEDGQARIASFDGNPNDFVMDVPTEMLDPTGITLAILTDAILARGWEPNGYVDIEGGRRFRYLASGGVNDIRSWIDLPPQQGMHERHLPDMPDVVDDQIRPGDFYEDCGFIPRLCVRVDLDEDELIGISLVHGGTGSCSPTHCGPRKLSFVEAIGIARTGINWSRCPSCGHSQVDHRDLIQGGCDHESGCDCDHVWAPPTSVGW